VTVVVNVNNTAGGVVSIFYDGENHTAEVIDGVANVNLGIIGPNILVSGLEAVYSGDKNFYSNSTDIDEFTTRKLENATIDVEVIPREYGDNTTIIIKVPAGDDGNMTIYIDGYDPIVRTPDANGTVMLNITPDVGFYTVNVTYTNSSRYADKENNDTNFTIAKDSHYDFNVTVTPSEDIKYGQEVTITINAPADVGVVNLTIDNGEVIPVTINATGQGVYKLSNLSAGSHDVEASFAGNDNYDKMSNSTSFNIAPIAPTMGIVVDPYNPDAGSSAVVYVTLPVNATGFVNIIVDGKDHFVPIKDGEANYTFENAQPGKHNVTVVYDGDKNYTRATGDDSFVAGTYPVTLDVDTKIDENNNVTVIVRVPADAEGLLTLLSVILLTMLLLKMVLLR
jgi:hypothetical protein